MKQRLVFLFDIFNQNLLLKGSFFVFLGAMAANFFTYLFQVLMGRVLTPTDYGTLIALRAVIPYEFIFASAFQAALVKKTAELKGQENWSQIVRLFQDSGKVLVFFSILLGILFTVFSSPLALFLKVSEERLVFWVGILAAVSFLAILPLAFLQGLLRFKAWAFLQGLTAFLILILSVLAVQINLGMKGIFWASILAVLLTQLIGFWLLAKNLSPKAFLNLRDLELVQLREILNFAAPTTLISFSMMAFFNTDILLVKHFFNESAAGIYSSAAILGRIIFFGTGAVAGVLLPVVSERVAKGLSFQKIFSLGLGLVLLGSLFITAFYIFAPEFTIKILFGTKYLGAVSILGWMGIFMTLYSILNLLNSLFLSLGKTMIAAPLLLGSLIQATLIWFFHDSLSTVIKISSLVVFGLICLLSLYYLKLEKSMKYG